MVPARWTRPLAIALLLAAPAVPAASQVSSGETTGAPTVLERMLRENLGKEQYIARVLAPMRRFDTDRNGLDAAEIDAADDRRLAATRSRQMQTLRRYDLDWDGRVTRAEVRRVTAASRFGHGLVLNDEMQEKLVVKAVERVMQADTDGDDVVTLEEMRVQQDGTAIPAPSETERARALLALDQDKNGRLTADALTRLAAETFIRYDTDNSGVLSAGEVGPVVERVRHETALEHALANCDLPKASANGHVAMLGIYEGRSVPSITVAGPDGATSTGKVVIESGKKPLYLVLSSNAPMIWQLEGDTARVAQAVVVGRQRDGGLGVGVTGLSKDRIAFVDSGRCRLSFHDMTSADAAQARGIFQHTAGRPVDSLAAAYGLLTVKMPSGESVAGPAPERKAPSGIPAHLWEEYVRFAPGGLTPIDAMTVVSPGPVQRYDVLPVHAGLVQLLTSGAIETLSRDTYRIVRPIARYPAGLFGAHSATFILGKGVPMPAGTPGQSCVFSEETGLAVTRQSHCVLR